MELDPVTQPGEGVRALVESMLEAALEEKIILDAAVAQSETQARAFWSLREFISEAQAHEGPNIKHDMSIPISRIDDFISATDQELARAHADTSNGLSDTTATETFTTMYPPPKELPRTFLSRTRRRSIAWCTTAWRVSAGRSAPSMDSAS
jgi:FAD/FMN-containing dehydrogenase